MTSKERLTAVLSGKIPDRVPVSTYELVGYNKNSFENRDPSYKKLMDLIREKTDCLYMENIYKVKTQTEIPDINTYIKSNTHKKSYREGKSVFVEYTLVTPKGDLTRKERTDDDVYTTWTLSHYLKNEDDLEKYMSIPDKMETPGCSHLFPIEKDLEDKGLLLLSYADPICVAAELFEFGEFTIMALTETEKIVRLMDKIYGLSFTYLKEALKQVKDKQYIFRIVGPEYATPPYLSSDYFHKFVCKYDKSYVDAIRASGNFARLHLHGKIKSVVPHLLEIGPDAMDPVEAPPSGDLPLKEAKAMTKGKMALFGNIQLRDLENATPEEMEKITKECLQDGMEGGGFVIMPTAAPINTPLSPKTEANYITFIETAIRDGTY